MVIIIALLIGYLIGSIPIGYLYGKLRGINIREVGFKRIGASNIYKTFGFIPAVLVFFADFLKPILAILIIKLISPHNPISYISGIFAIIGHNWPIWLKFKGEGRGVASTLGFLYYLAPRETIILFTILSPITIWLRSSPFITFVFFCIIPFVILLFGEPILFFYLSLSVSLLILLSRIIGSSKEIKTSPDKRQVFLNLLLFDNANRFRERKKT
jgi:glycerol-3-phosphate acyltransferase PlsY